MKRTKNINAKNETHGRTDVRSKVIVSHESKRKKEKYNSFNPYPEH